MDKELAKIIRDALKAPNPKCPECKVEGEMKGYSNILAICKCPKCGQVIGDSVIY